MRCWAMLRCNRLHYHNNAFTKTNLDPIYVLAITIHHSTEELVSTQSATSGSRQRRWHIDSKQTTLAAPKGSSRTRFPCKLAAVTIRYGWRAFVMLRGTLATVFWSRNIIDKTDFNRVTSIFAINFQIKIEGEKYAPRPYEGLNENFELQKEISIVCRIRSECPFAVYLWVVFVTGQTRGIIQTVRGRLPTVQRLAH